MIITISGALGAGKSTIAKIVAAVLGYAHMSTGDFMRAMAKERGISFPEFTQLAKSDLAIDKEIDQQSKKLVESGADNLVIDTRLGFYFIPESFKIYLDVDDKEAAHRIFLAKRADEPNKTEQDVLDFIQIRKQAEIERYMGLYEINCHDVSAGYYDAVIDTTKKSIPAVVEAVIKSMVDAGKLGEEFLEKAASYDYGDL